MRIALLSDIHGNLEALTACLADASARKADRYVFLGDIVGYGADPIACLDHVRDAAARGAIVVRGNHDEAVVSTDFRLNQSARLAVDWTRARLSADHIRYLAGLPLTATDAAIEGGGLYVHASAATPARFPYVQRVEDAQASFAATPAAITVAGHVHVPALYHQTVTGTCAGFTPISNVATPLSSRRRWLAILGAVGQPRDGIPAAAYAVFDTATTAITYARVAYDIERAAAKIRSAGLPDSLWKRLSFGT
jgi:diadenosine tetraphosphatase ApaH/serine/threonine PP2A family protein phosphatase